MAPRDPMADTASKMALTKSDLLDLLSQFKKELRADLKADITKELQDFQTDLNEKMVMLRSEIDSAGARVVEAESPGIRTQHSSAKEGNAMSTQ